MRPSTSSSEGKSISLKGVVYSADLSATSFVHQYDEELAEIKQARRPGRPASAREDLLKVKITSLEKEYKNGFRES